MNPIKEIYELTGADVFDKDICEWQITSDEVIIKDVYGITYYLKFSNPHLERHKTLLLL